MGKILKRILVVFLISIYFRQVLLQNTLTLSSTKETVLENNSVALTCFNKSGVLLESRWESSMYNDTAACARVGNKCLKSRFLNNSNLINCTCNDDGTYSVKLKIVNRFQHGVRWRCGYRSIESNTVVISVSVPVTHAILTQITGNNPLYENTSATFTCTSSYSLPSAQIHWYRSYKSSTVGLTGSRNVNIKRETHTRVDNVILVTEILLFRVNRSINGWSVYCTATNWQRSVVTSDKIELSVIYPPDSSPVINGFTSGSIYRVIENENSILSCSVKGGNPLGKPEWHCERIDNITSNEHITDNGKVTSYLSWIAKRTDGKTCTCQTGHILSNVTVYINIDVLYPPGIPDIQLQRLSKWKNITSDANLIEHKSYRLLCMAYANPPSEYIWDGPQRLSLSYNATVDFPDVKRTQNGTYICHARNILHPTYGQNLTTEKTSKVNINILFKPTAAVIKKQNIAEGSTLNITCEAISANPNVTYIWTRDSDDFHRNSKELLLHNVSRHDAMNYTCTVKIYMTPTVGEDEEGYASETFYLNVWYRGSVGKFVVNGHENNVPVVTSESNSITFNCEIDSNPNSTVKLITPNGTEIISTGANVLEYTHFMSSCVDNGTFTCSGSNDYNYGQPGLAKLAVFVKCTPMAFPNTKTDVRSKLYVPVILQLRAVAYPEPEFSWEKWTNGSWKQLTNDNMFSISSYKLQTYLIVINFTTTEIYRLLVVNEIGTLIQDYTLKPVERPVTPKEFRHIEELLTDTSVTLLWKPGFNGGISQTFIITYTDAKELESKHIVIQDTGTTPMNLTLHGLTSDTRYKFNLFALNSEGSSGSVTLQIKTKRYFEGTQANSPVIGIILGVISLLVLVVAIAVFILLRRRYKKKSDSSKEERSYDNLTEMTTVSGGKPSVTHEPVYEGLRPDTERGDKRMEQAYEILKPEQGPDGATIQTYTNLKL